MYQLDDQLAIYKFNLINKFLNSKGKDAAYLKELRNKFILVNELIKRSKENNQINCSEELKEIKDFIAKTR